MIEKEILHRLFLAHYNDMLRLSKALLYDGDEAEDAVQDVFLRLMQADILPAEDKMRAYLLTAVRHQCLNRIRHKSLKDQVRGLYLIELQAQTQDEAAQNEAIAAVADCAERLLTEPHITIFRLRFRHGLKLKEIAQQTGINLKTVHKYLKQSILSLQTVTKTI